MNTLNNLTKLSIGLAWLLFPGVASSQTLLEENFDSVTLGPNVDEGVASDMAWTAAAPNGWTVDNSNMPMLDGEVLGTTEWRGWTFADNDWWASVDDQRRSEFEKSEGPAAIADPDEWDDVGSPAGVGRFESYLVSPVIDVTGVAGASVSIIFDFSWRPEGDQKGIVDVAFDGGEPQEVFRLDTASTNDDMTNETAEVNFVVPDGAAEAVVRFGMVDAGNNWFWAVDNIVVQRTTLFSEGFDSVTLGPNVDETVVSDMAWTATPPEGWTVDNSNMPMADGEVLGTTEWRGWTFADNDWWASVDDQRRSEFEKSVGVAAVADPDEWDDVGSPAGVGNFESYLISPAIDVSSVAGGRALFSFDFTWRPEGNQTGNVTVAFDGGEALEILRLDTASTSDMTNESRTIPFDVPAGAQALTLTFGMFDAGNNWFWAIDNIAVAPASDPVLPSNFAAVGDVLAKKATLTWEPAANLLGTIEVLRNGEVIAELPIDATSYEDSPPGVDAGGEVSFTYAIRVNSDGAPGGPIEGFEITDVTAPDAERIQLTWTSSEGTSYFIETSADGQAWQRDDAEITGTADTTTAEIQRAANADLELIRVGTAAGGGGLTLSQEVVFASDAPVYQEDFDSVVLGPNVDETVASDMAWSATPPEGWTVDNSNMPMADGEVLGTTEWRGWTFADPAWWASVDDQRRSDFTKASGVAAIADPDEWDDVGSPAGVGNFESYLVSPSIDVTELAGGPALIAFDYSWRPEGNQTGNVTVAFNGGEETEVFRLDTATTADDRTNESAAVEVMIPADATEVVLRFGMFDAGNNWFWAVDNIALRPVPMQILFEENFDSVVLGESVDEGGLGEGMDWTAEPPAGWTVDNSNMPMDAGELIGTTEWRGWTFADPVFWAQVDDQRRSEFTNASGAIAIADPDEWDDVGGPAGVGNFESYLISPPINVSSNAGGNVSVVFDSSWRPEGSQTGNVTVAFDGGAAQEVLRLDSATTSDDETNEVKVVPVSIPGGAQEMVLTFGMFDAGNNWWWGIDNILVTTQAVPVCPTGFSAAVNKTASTVELSWIAGSNLGDATLQVWRNGVMIAEGLDGHSANYSDAITVEDPNESLLFEYELRVIGGPIECEPLTRTVVFSQGAVQKLAQWDFEEGNGNIAANSVNENFAGDLVDLSENSWVDAGFLGGAIQFEGDGYIDLGTSETDDDTRAKSDALRPLAGITLSAWVNPTDFTEWAGIAGSLFDSGSNEGGFYLNTRSPSDFSFALATESDGQLTYLRAEGVTDEWTHVVGTYDGQEQRLYLNGEVVAARDAAGPIDYEPAPYGFQIGTFIDDNEDIRFSGQISQVAIWDGALSEDEIVLLYEIGRTGENIDPALDSDGDGLLDEWEIANFGDIAAQSALGDPDGDQLINLSENRAGTDPNKEDTDGDGVNDSTEIAFGSDATDGGAKPADNAVALAKSNGSTDSWATPDVWSNGEAPSGGKVYFANGEFATNLRTPAEASAFAGDSLELFNGAHLIVQGPSATIPQLTLRPGRIVHGGSNGSTVRIGGEGDTLSVTEDSNIFFAQNQGILEIGSTITGAGSLNLTPFSPFRGSAFEGGTVVLLGANSDFTGGWEVEDVTLKPAAEGSLGNADITLINATLDPDVDVSLPEQKLTLVGGLVKLVLDQDITFGAVSVGDQFNFENGTYTATDLLGLGFTEDNVVDGGGSLIVGGQ